MSSLPTGSTVLVTGASGFIASWVVQQLLENPKSYYVRGTVRSQAKGDYLKKLFSKFEDRFEVVIVEDMQKDGAFDEAVKGVDAIEHTASPFHFRAEDPEELIAPAVKGTLGILESVAKNAPGVKRIVITSSNAAVTEIGSQMPGTFTENDWNEESPREISQKGSHALAVHKYRASKVLAEKAAWDWMKIHQSQVNFDVVVTNPVYVFGPIIHEVHNISQLNTSSLEFYNTIQGKRPRDTVANFVSCYVDVRDVAFAHVEALDRKEFGGKRLLLAAGPFSWQDFVDALSHSAISSYFPNLPKDGEGTSKASQAPLTIDNTKTKQLLGKGGMAYQFLGVDRVAEDTAKSFVEHGW